MKFEVTPELASLMQIFSANTKTAAKDLAAYIGKSPAYVSRLKNGAIKTIKEEELTQVLDYLIPGENFYEDKLPSAVRVLNSICLREAVLKQMWLLYYDGFKRPVRIPGELAENLCSQMEESGISAEELASYMRTMPDLPAAQNFPANEIVVFTFRDLTCLFVRIDLDVPRLEALLKKENTVSSFLVIQAVVSAVFRMRMYSKGSLTDEQLETVLKQATSFLEQYGIQSLTVSGGLAESKQILQESRTMEPAIKKASTENISEIQRIFQNLLESDGPEAAKALEVLRRNLEQNSRLTEKILSIPLDQMPQKDLEKMEHFLEKYGC